jgi:hypothetical protein
MGLLDTRARLSVGRERQLETTYSSWPKCWPCSDRLRRWQPVHVYGDERAERASLVIAGYKLEFFARCHRCDREDTFSVEVPAMMGQASRAQIIGAIAVFGPWKGGAKHFTADPWLKLARVGKSRS